MLDITIISVGKTKEKYFRDAETEYFKRLQPYARIKSVILEPAPFSRSTKEKSKETEGQRILNLLEDIERKGRASIYLLAERGRSFSSPEMAKWIDDNQPLVLVIGGTLGFSDELYKRYPQISLSPLTFPHELARIVLLEQLYRAATILIGKDYHY